LFEVAEGCAAWAERGWNYFPLVSGAHAIENGIRSSP
jgi:hypothetical protein